MEASWMSCVTNPYAPTNTLQLTLPGSRTQTTVRVAKAFTPFTNSQVLLVDATTPNDSLPKQFILKLADRRFGERHGEPTWTPVIEHEFQLCMAHHIAEHGMYPTVNAHGDLSPNFPVHYDSDQDPPNWLTELRMWYSRERYLTTEANTYRHLIDAQRLGLVPRFYGEAEILMSPGMAPNHPAFQSVRGILLEHIPGQTMNSVRIGKDITVEQAEDVSQKLIALGRQIRRYGVVHCDLHFGNVVLCSLDRTPVLIDWGEADFQMADNPSLSERWNTAGMAQDFEIDIRYWLKNDQEVRWHRHQTPYDDATWREIARNHGSDKSAWEWVNWSVREDMTENEREAMYIEDASVDAGQGLRWRIKPGVKTRKFRDPAPCS